MPDSYAPLLSVDLGAVLANFNLLSRRALPAVAGAVVKADAYGLGAAVIAPLLKRAGCSDFFVATVDEGMALRQALLPGVRIYLLGGLPPGSEREIDAAGLIPVLNTLAEVDRWQAYQKGPGSDGALRRQAALHLDTGLNRLGLTLGECRALAADPRRIGAGNIGLVLSHLACADDPEHPMNRRQLAALRELLAALKLPPVQGRKPLVSLAASSGIFLGPDYHFDLVRPGASLYGINPLLGAPNPLRPALRLQAKILQLRDVDLDMTVGYGASHQVRGPTRIATLGVGYADGIFRSLGNRGWVVVAGQRAPIVGRISMDLMTIDVGHLPPEAATPGTLVDLIGPQQSIDQLAADAGTIGYEVLTNLGARFQRRYSGG
ncbi:alanine racemase [Dongia mobilis]|uniref:Alanine racemase n=1 Tax=Dongia mobilis TaxID=578943 RepID=A0A4R6WF77_9PROT|nr:alanine racemase [Dongia mobilis]TDQ78486.1 alanine racemase [Dongia mobilis]